MSKAISYETTCGNCGTPIEVMLHPADPGQPDPNQSNCCPPTPAYNDPNECPVCYHEILIEDINQHLANHKEAEAEHKSGL